MVPNLGFFPNISHQIDLFLFRRGKEALLSISEITKQIETTAHLPLDPVIKPQSF
jgi:hypothetical protein